MKKVALRIGVMVAAYVLVALIMLNITNPTGRASTFLHPQPNITNIHTMYVKAKDCSSVYELEKILTDLDIDFSIKDNILSTAKIKFKINEDKSIEVLSSLYTDHFDRIDNKDNVHIKKINIDNTTFEEITLDEGFIIKLGDEYFVNRWLREYIIVPLIAAFGALALMLFLSGLGYDYF